MKARLHGIVGGGLLLLFPILLVPFSWVIALPTTLVAFLGWFPLRERLLERNERYQRLHRIIPEFRIAAADPYLVLELHRVESRDGLAGGIATL